VRQHDDTYKQKDLKSMFGKAVDAGATVMDLEDAVGGRTMVPKGGRATSRRKRLTAPKEGADGSGPMEVEGGEEDAAGEEEEEGGEEEAEEGAAAATTAKRGKAAATAKGKGKGKGKGAAATQAVQEPAVAPVCTELDAAYGSAEWLAARQRQWQAMRSMRKKRANVEESEVLQASFGNGAAPRRRAPAAAAGAMNAFFADSAMTVNSSAWQVLTLQEGAVPGELTAWVLLGTGGSAILHSIPVRVPHTVYVNMLAPHEAPGWTKVSRTLPHGAAPRYMYEVTMTEEEFQSSAGDVGKWLQHQGVHAVYHTQFSPLLRAIAHLGCCCHVSRGVPRRSPHEGFDLHELRPLAHQADYLRVEEGGAAACKQLMVYAAGEARRGVLMVLAEWHDFGMIIVVKPRGAALSEQVKPAAHAHPMAGRCANLAVESVDTWEAAFKAVQRLLPGLQAEAKGPVIAFAQSSSPLHELQGWVPALRQMPTVPVPHNATDDAFEQALQLGGAWQVAAVERALNRAQELGPWWEQRLELARYANLPAGSLLGDAEVFAADMQLQRRLLQSGHVSWLSGSPRPDLGGLSVHEGGAAEELPTCEATLPGMYRSMCVELTLHGLCVNTVLESRHVHTLDGVDLARDMGSGEGGGDAVDENSMTASAFRLIKHLVQEWMRDVINHNEPQADALLMNVYRWVASDSSLLYDPALHKLVHSLMRKVWLQLLAELRGLGAKVVFASFGKVIIATPKESLRDAQDYCRFIIGSLQQKQLFNFLTLEPVTFWSSLLFLDSANYGGITHVAPSTTALGQASKSGAEEEVEEPFEVAPEPMRDEGEGEAETEAAEAAAEAAEERAEADADADAPMQEVSAPEVEEEEVAAGGSDTPPAEEEEALEADEEAAIAAAEAAAAAAEAEAGAMEAEVEEAMQQAEAMEAEEAAAPSAEAAARAEATSRAARASVGDALAAALDDDDDDDEEAAQMDESAEGEASDALAATQPAEGAAAASAEETQAAAGSETQPAEEVEAAGTSAGAEGAAAVGGPDAAKAADDVGADGADEGTGATGATGAPSAEAGASDAPAEEAAAAVATDADAGPVDDLVTALPVMKWNVGEFLPPAIRQYFETSVALFVWEPWHEAALKAAAEGRAAPSLDEVTAASVTFFEGLFSTKVRPYPPPQP